MTLDVAVIGEALVDVVHRPDGSRSRHPGGSCANVAVALARLGRDVELLTQLGVDSDGRLVEDWLLSSGVKISRAGEADRTSSAIAELDRSGSANYVFDVSWNATVSSLPPARIIHTGSIASTLAPGAIEVEKLVRAARAQSLVTYDPNIRPALVANRAACVAKVEDFVRIADVVKVSTEDLAWLYPDEFPGEVARRWLDGAPQIVVVTDGGDGARAVTAHSNLRVQPVSVEVVDTVGAGDTFMGALIDGLVGVGVGGAAGRPHLGAIPTEHLGGLLARAATAAAITVSRPGADPPMKEELDAQPLP